MDIRWLILAALAVAIAQAFLFRRYGLRHLTYQRYFNEQAVYCNEQIELIERIENAKWLALPWVTVESMFPTGLHFGPMTETAVLSGEAFQYHHSLFTLSAFTRVTRRHRITCIARGVYGMQDATLTCGDLLGGKPHFIQIHAQSKLIVYPAIVPLQEIPLPTHSWQGPIAVRRFVLPDPFTIAGTRDYQQGDPLNQIHWSATARSGRLQVHKRDFTADYQLMILLNFEVSEEMWEIVTDPALIERGLSFAATLVQEATSLGVEVGFACNGTLPEESSSYALARSANNTGSDRDRENRSYPHFYPRAGLPHLHTVLTAMAEVTMRCAGSFHSLVTREQEDTYRPLDYLIITAHQSARLKDSVDALETVGHTVTIVPLDKPPTA
ncbi:MAG: DUF58 domain-containing protein [Firmicutes bacterium]|nr:DUF58 domain-containing protein [Bacillota bacterium]